MPDRAPIPRHPREGLNPDNGGRLVVDGDSNDAGSEQQDHKSRGVAAN